MVSTVIVRVVAVDPLDDPARSPNDVVIVNVEPLTEATVPESPPKPRILPAPPDALFVPVPEAAHEVDGSTVTVVAVIGPVIAMPPRGRVALPDGRALGIPDARPPPPKPPSRTDTQAPLTTAAADDDASELMLVDAAYVTTAAAPWLVVTCNESEVTDPMTPSTDGRRAKSPRPRPLVDADAVEVAFAADDDPDPQAASDITRPAPATTDATRTLLLLNMIHSFLKASMGASLAARLAG